MVQARYSAKTVGGSLARIEGLIGAIIINSTGQERGRQGLTFFFFNEFDDYVTKIMEMTLNHTIQLATADYPLQVHVSTSS